MTKCITGGMRTCPTSAVQVVLDFILFHVIMQSVVKRTTLRIFQKLQSFEAVQTRDMSQDDIFKKLNLMKEITTKFTNKNDHTYFLN